MTIKRTTLLRTLAVVAVLGASVTLTVLIDRLIARDGIGFAVSSLGICVILRELLRK